MKTNYVRSALYEILFTKVKKKILDLAVLVESKKK